MIGIANIFRNGKRQRASRIKQKTLGIYGEEEFKKILERGRARADRNGHCFSIVSIDLADSRSAVINIQHLIELLEKRIRLTDVIGWMDEKRIGVYLFDLPGTEAHNFFGKIIAQNGSHIPYDVFTYPYNHVRFQGKDKTHLSGQNGECIADLSASHSEAQSKNENSCAFGCNSDIATESSLKGAETMLGHPIPKWKRSMDLVLAGFGLILLLPLLLVVGLLIKIVSPGPLFFKQTRVGYLGRPFVLWKFRTMRVNSDTTRHQGYLHDLMNNGKPMIKLENDPQIIPFGGILRKSGIDELPQLINVIRGEMSLVGPRPPIPYEVEKYSRWFHGRFDINPGLTGLWQVSGKNKLSFQEMIRLDIQYRRRVSFLFDWWIILKTPFAIWAQIADKPEFNRHQNDRILEEST